MGYKRGGQTPIKKLKKPPWLNFLDSMMHDIALISIKLSIKQE
jgi:hypothetical protein